MKKYFFLVLIFSSKFVFSQLTEDQIKLIEKTIRKIERKKINYLTIETSNDEETKLLKTNLESLKVRKICNNFTFYYCNNLDSNCFNEYKNKLHFIYNNSYIIESTNINNERCTLYSFGYHLDLWNGAIHNVNIRRPDYIQNLTLYSRSSTEILFNILGTEEYYLKKEKSYIKRNSWYKNGLVQWDSEKKIRVRIFHKEEFNLTDFELFIKELDKNEDKYFTEDGELYFLIPWGVYGLFQSQVAEVIQLKEKKLKQNAINEGTYTGYVENYKTGQGVYTGNLVNGKPDGYGVLRYSVSIRNNGDRAEAIYNGNFKNGEFNGFGKLNIKEYRFRSNSNNVDDLYIETYEGEFIEGKYEGKGKLYVWDKYSRLYSYEGEFINNNFDGVGTMSYSYNIFTNVYSIDKDMILSGNWAGGQLNGKAKIKNTHEDNRGQKALSEVEGNYSNGKRDGIFKITGNFKGYGYNYSYYTRYINGEPTGEVTAVEYDDYDKLIETKQEEARIKNAILRAEKAEKCSNCNINWAKSKSPKDEYTLWVKTGRNSGEIHMTNGDIYDFDYDKGRCKVVKSFFESDDYFKSFDEMISDLLIKCKNKYCN